MNKKMLERVISENKYIEGGTKEACVKVREFIIHAKANKQELCAAHSCINAQEFLDAVYVLLAHTFSNYDEIPESWHCDSDCRDISKPFCRGECNAKKGATALCPYFVDDSLV